MRVNTVPAAATNNGLHSSNFTETPMNAQMVTPRPPPAGSPVEDFSQCHVGIVAQLAALGTLPTMLETARRARRIASDTLEFFDAVVREHHGAEERELFPAVLDSAASGEERGHIAALVQRLTAEHRQLESQWALLKPALRHAAKGRDANLDAAAVERLVSDYRAHAQFEELVFLPAAQNILGRNANHLEALGLSLHLRHARPVVGYI